MKTILVLLSISFSFNVFSMVENDRRIKKSKGFNYKSHYRHAKMYKVKNKIFNFNNCKNAVHHG